MASYFLYGYYGFGNFGDDLLLQTLITGIRARDPEARFVVRARAPVEAFAADAGVRFLLIEDILEDRRRGRIAKFLTYRAALLAEVRRCDVSLVGGGTLFIDKGRFNWTLVFMHELLRAARAAGRRTVIIGVAIDILAHPLSVWLVRRIFALAGFAAVRDALSLAYFQSGGQTPRLASDLAWLWHRPALQAAPRLRRAVGLNFIDYFRTSTKNEMAHQAYRDALLRMLERHGAEYDFHLVVLQRGIGQRDDWFDEAFRAHVPQGQVFHVDGAAALGLALSHLDAIVTTRFHLALLAARENIPTCVIDHELKLTSLAQDLGLPTVPMYEFIGADVAQDPIERLQAWDAGRTQRAVRRQEQLAQVNLEWLV
jgi:polysaccharide pyruvyl transferase WcaK-like protein